MLGLSWPDLMRLRTLQGTQVAKPGWGRAKRVLLLYLQGAASQLETWDPKPDAAVEVRGKWGATSTAVPGIQICDQLPKLAQVTDRLAIVRSMSHDYNNHSNAYTLTGHPTVDFSSETNPDDDRHHPFLSAYSTTLPTRDTRLKGGLLKVSTFLGIWGFPFDSVDTRPYFVVRVPMVLF